MPLPMEPAIPLRIVRLVETVARAFLPAGEQVSDRLLRRKRARVRHMRECRWTPGARPDHFEARAVAVRDHALSGAGRGAAIRHDLPRCAL